MILMISVGTNPAYRAFRGFSWSPLVVLGAFSYSIYLVHALVLVLIGQALTTFARMGAFQIFLFEGTIGVAIVISASYLFHLAFERPFMNHKENRTAGQMRSIAESST